MNATYFKGVWQNEFDKDFTTRESFYGLNRKDSKVDFMHSERADAYSRSENMQAVALPFGNGSFEMVALLPEENLDFNSFVGNLSWAEINNAVSNLTCSKIVKLSLPKFESKWNGDLSSLLNKMGLNQALSNGFNKILKNGSFAIDQVLHAVNIKVDEKGAEAAAASQITMVTSPGPDEDPEIIELNFNRPFVYLIRECSTGAILFMGSVTTL